MKIEIRETKREGWTQITTIDSRWYRRAEDNRDFASLTWICKYVPKGKHFLKWLADTGWDEAQEIRDAAGEKGSRVHKAIEVLLNGGTVSITDVFPDNEKGELKELSAEEYWAILTFQDWWNDFTQNTTTEGRGKDKKTVATKADIQILGIEMTHYNEELGYACTLDLHLLRDGVPYIIDFKTSKGVNLGHEIQLAGISHCDELRDTPHKLCIVQVGYAGNKRGWKLTEIERDRWPLFLAAREFWIAENADKHPQQHEYPNTITLSLTKEDK